MVSFRWIGSFVWVGLGVRINYKIIIWVFNYLSLWWIYVLLKWECVYRIIEYIIDLIGFFVDKINIGFKDIFNLLF